MLSQVAINKTELANHIHHALKDKSQVTLRDLIESRPLLQGLAELVAYSQLGSEQFRTLLDESAEDMITWQSPAWNWCWTKPKVMFFYAPELEQTTNRRNCRT